MPSLSLTLNVEPVNGYHLFLVSCAFVAILTGLSGLGIFGKWVLGLGILVPYPRKQIASILADFDDVLSKCECTLTR